MSTRSREIWDRLEAIEQEVRLTPAYRSLDWKVWQACYARDTHGGTPAYRQAQKDWMLLCGQFAEHTDDRTDEIVVEGRVLRRTDSPAFVEYDRLQHIVDELIAERDALFASLMDTEEVRTLKQARREISKTEFKAEQEAAVAVAREKREAFVRRLAGVVANWGQS